MAEAPDPSIPTPGGALLAELGIAFFALWIDAFLPGKTGNPFLPSWQLAAAARSATKIALVLWLMHRGRGLTAYGFREKRIAPSPADFAWAVAIAAAVGIAALAIAFLAGSTGFSNPLLAGGRITGSLPAYLGAAALSCIAVGYAEELFFRCFAQDSLERAGLGRFAAAAACSLAFGAAHGAQGLAGMAGAFALGGIFSGFRLSGRSPHALAIGHALYDFSILAIVATLS